MDDSDPIVKWLYGRQMHGIRLGLANITVLLDRLGNPQRSFRSVHVAGTDGKGSVCACIDSILRASGLRTGLYTSPHLLEFNERIKIDGIDAKDEDIKSLARQVRPVTEAMDAEGMGCTFFEVTTAMAFLHFKNEKVDCAVVEVGLGGRFDATNVITPEVCVIGNISLEHTDYLGDTIEKIAFEKAGIIKKGVPCITLNGEPAFGVIAREAESAGAPLIRVDPDDIAVRENRGDGVSFSYKGEFYNVAIPGRHQARNAALAIEAVSRLNPDACFRCAVMDGLSDVRWPCRMEKIPGLPLIIDVTHTFAGSGDLAADVEEIYGKVTVVFGILGDKDAEHIACNLSKIASKAIVAAPDSPRALPAGKAAEIMGRYCKTEVAGSVGEGIESAMKSGGTVLVTGSLYMAGEALRWLKKTYPDF